MHDLVVPPPAASASAGEVMDPRFQRARLQTVAARLRDAPPDLGFEVAFAGRSNAGKSSAINTICHQNRLAKTSKTPGRTQQLVFFRLDDERRLVDLPGYGFARVSRAMKADWQALMGRYLERRRCLRGLVVVMDIRHPLTETDRRMLAWGVASGRPMRVLLTKADKLSRAAARRTLARVKRAIAEAALNSEVRVDVQTFSATSRLGLTGAHVQLAQWLELPPGS